MNTFSPYGAFSLALPFMATNATFFLAPQKLRGLETVLIPSALCTSRNKDQDFKTASTLDCLDSHKKLLRIVSCNYLPSEQGPYTACFFAQSLAEIPAGIYHVRAQTDGYSLAVITLSDKAFAGKRKDESGPLVQKLIQTNLPITHNAAFLLPDEPALLRGLLADLALYQNYDLIICTGGTGLSPRDSTPEAVRPLLEKELPGFSFAMFVASLTQTPHALISRGIAGLIGSSLVFTLPGSKKAVLEHLNAVLPTLDHALAKIKGEALDCAR